MTVLVTVGAGANAVHWVPVFQSVSLMLFPHQLHAFVK
jgi:hypothetical protein